MESFAVLALKTLNDAVLCDSQFSRMPLNLGSIDRDQGANEEECCKLCCSNAVCLLLPSSVCHIACADNQNGGGFVNGFFYMIFLE
jgi:hypothetical protein